MITAATKRVVERLWKDNILPHNVDDAEEFKRQVATLIQGMYFGEEPHPRQGLEINERYVRREDMGAGQVEVLVEEDGDVILTVVDDNGTSASVQFCTGVTGGGRSVRTKDALLALCHAIKADSEARA